MFKQDATEQLVLEGQILDSGEFLYLEPTWINELLRAVLDHDLADASKEKFWKDQLEAFSGTNTEVYWDLKKVHDNFPSTGILTKKYLSFLWRYVTGISNKALFESLLEMMFRHGVIFRGNPSGAGNELAGDALDDDVVLFVPLHLPTKILENDLEITTLLKHQFRKDLVYEIRQTYVPPGVLGLLMSRLLVGDVKFHMCWSRGVVFTLDGVLVLLHLDTPADDDDEAWITVNLFGEKFVSKLTPVMDQVEREIKSTFVQHFNGLRVCPKQGYPRDENGIDAATSMCAVDLLNAVVARIDGLETHHDRGLNQACSKD